MCLARVSSGRGRAQGQAVTVATMARHARRWWARRLRVGRTVMAVMGPINAAARTGVMRVMVEMAGTAAMAAMAATTAAAAMHRS